MESEIYTVSVIGIAILGGLLALLVLHLRSLRLTLRIDQGKTTAILEAAADGIITIDDRGLIASFNSAAERLFGYRAAEVLGRNVRMLMPEPYRSEHDGHIDHYLITGHARIIGIGREVVGQRKDGSTFPMELAVGESRSGGRRLFAGIARDISGRRKSEQQLHDAEIKIRAILETAVDGILTIDQQGTILTANPATEHLFGYRVEEMVGNKVNMLMPDSYRSAHDGYLEHYLTTGERHIIGIGREVHGQRKDGSTFPMELSVGEAMVSGTRIFTGVVRDITERKRSEEDLRQSEERFRLLVENIPDYAIIWLDNKGRIASWNAGAQHISGWTAQEAVGQPMEVFYPPDAQAEPQRALAQVRDTGRYEGEDWQLDKKGERAWVHQVITPLWDADGKMRGFVRVARDITDRRRAEEALRAAKNEAERAHLAQSRFLAAASHDLRQPVQALTLFAAALAAKIKGAPAAALLEDMTRSLEALNTLLDALLDVSRLDAGAIIPYETTFSLATVMEQLAAEFEPQARQKEIGLRVVPSSAVVRTDPTLLYRILQNFLSNSVRYTNHGRIVIGCRRKGRKLRIEVLDSGIGIPEHLQQEIFTEFFQVGNFERDRTKGLGLGLAIVQRLSQLLRCPVTVRSQEGRGAAFGVEVTLVGFNKTANVVSVRPTMVLKQPIAGKGLVFVIDDEPSVLKGLRVVIENWGFTVLTARTEREAITTLIDRQAPDIIIADYRLRGTCNGAQVVARIRQTFSQAIPGILITGDTAPERIREANAHGLTLLHKPVQPAALYAAIAGNLSPHAAGEPQGSGATSEES